MNATTHPDTQIVIDDEVPMVHITREFDAPASKVYRAHIDPELFVQWCGPRYLTTRLDRWDPVTGGGFRYVQQHDDEEYGFFGSFHELREDALIVQTFCFEGFPDGVALERMVLEDLPGGRSRITCTSLVDSFEGRDAFVASGMEVGVVEGYEQLDDVLSQG